MAFASDKSRQGAAGSTGYDIDNSLRFNDDDSAYLNKTPSSAGNRKTFTFSGWIKRGNIGASYQIFQQRADSDSSQQFTLQFRSDDQLRILDQSGGSTVMLKQTSAVFRDTSAWYHIVVAIDITESAVADKAKIWVNGEAVLDWSTETNYADNTTYDTAVNTTVRCLIGASRPNASGTLNSYLDGYLAEVHFIDGTALDHTSFGETGDYGEWKAKKVSGLTYGTNGFYLDFKTSGTLGNDANGSNNWTSNNLASTDQMLDTPTNNFCTLNPLDDAYSETTSGSLSEGNLDIDDTAGGTWFSRAGTVAPSSGKWYFEILVTSSNNYSQVGIHETSVATETGAGVFRYRSNGNKVTTGYSTYGANWAGSGAVIGVRFDLDSGSIKFYKGNISQGSFSMGTVAGSYAPVMMISNSASMIANFGQDSSFAGNKTAQGNQDGNDIGDFYYTPPSGFLALCTKNLPDPAVIPSEHFNTVLYTGNGTTGGNTQAISGVGFQPDFLWIKNRSNPINHYLNDTIRGTGAGTHLHSNTTSSESSASAYADNGGTESLDSNGFTVYRGTDNTYQGTNMSGNTYVAWNWKANGAGSSNTSGSITSTVSANADAGFSIVSYTSPNTTVDETYGHGLAKAPELVIVKNRDNTFNWDIYHKDLASGNDLTFTNAAARSNAWPTTVPTSSLVTVKYNYEHNSTHKYITYNFHSVDGYSKVGSYTGNGITDGTFVYCGFRPAYVMVKTTAIIESWYVWDTTRSTFNLIDDILDPDSSNAESVNADRSIDSLSNGFKLKGTNTATNGSGDTYIFYAIAESPFKHTNAR